MPLQVLTASVADVEGCGDATLGGGGATLGGDGGLAASGGDGGLAASGGDGACPGGVLGVTSIIGAGGACGKKINNFVAIRNMKCMLLYGNVRTRLLY